MNSNFNRCDLTKVEKNDDFEAIMVSGDGRPINFDVDINNFNEKIEKVRRKKKT